MNTKHVSIIIVTYKTAQLTIDCLGSIADERHDDNFEISAIVVDNSGQDYEVVSNAIIQNQWQDWVKVARPPENRGFAHGNNFGVKLARESRKPHYIHLLNPDTLVRAGGIRFLAEFLEKNPDAGIAGSSFENLDGSDWPYAFRFPTVFSEIEEGLQFGLASRLLARWIVARSMNKSIERVDWVPGASMMMKAGVFDAVGGLDERYFLYFEETDFCFRANKLGFQTWYVPQSRVMHIAGQSTKVTERQTEARRLPPYWFESRRLFFITSYGLLYAILTDIAAVSSRSLGGIKRLLQNKPGSGIPYFLRDLLQHSPLWARNCKFLKPT